jgi:hypothetical protein
MTSSHPARLAMNGAVLAVLLWPSGAPAQDNKNSALEKISLGTRGTSTTFMKRLEIMYDDAFSLDRPALPPQEAIKNLSRYDAIWAANFLPLYNRSAWNFLRRTHPSLLTLWYVTAASTRTPNDFHWFDYTYIERNHPEWFIVKEKGADPRDPDNRIRWSIHTTIPTDHDRFYVDVANTEFQRWAAAWILARVSGQHDGNTPKPFRSEPLDFPYHGCAMDGVDLGDLQSAIISKHHPNWQYAGRSAEWNSGFCQYLATVKAKLNEKGFILIVNHNLPNLTDADTTSWDCLYRSVDGCVSEQPMSWMNRPYTDSAFADSLQRHERTLDQGLIDWWVVYPSAADITDSRFFLYNYCSWLLVKKPGRSFFYATRGSPDESNPATPQYKEYELPIGAPQSRRYMQGQCWVREYENATIVVNPTQTPQSILVNGTVVELPATGGRIAVKSDGPKGDR